MALGPNGKVQIVFICTGNICRSPMGEFLLKNKLSPEMAKIVQVISAGTHAMEDMPASHNAKLTAKEFGVDLSDHNSQPLTRWLLGQCDVIFAMETDHVDIIHRMDPTASPRTFLLKEFGLSETEKNADKHIEDPISGSQDVYRKIYSEMDQEIDRIMPYLERVIQSVK